MLIVNEMKANNKNFPFHLTFLFSDLNVSRANKIPVINKDATANT